VDKIAKVKRTHKKNYWATVGYRYLDMIDAKMREIFGLFEARKYMGWKLQAIQAGLDPKLSTIEGRTFNIVGSHNECG
jgi:hypothetical protein